MRTWKHLCPAGAARSALPVLQDLRCRCCTAGAARSRVVNCTACLLDAGRSRTLPLSSVPGCGARMPLARMHFALSLLTPFHCLPPVPSHCLPPPIAYPCISPSHCLPPAFRPPIAYLLCLIPCACGPMARLRLCPRGFLCRSASLPHARTPVCRPCCI